MSGRTYGVTFLVIAVLAAVESASAQNACSRKNILGGYDYYEGGRYAGYSRANILGGYDYYDARHGYAGYSRKNIFGGLDYSWKGGGSASARPNGVGGYDVRGRTGWLGSARPNIFGGLQYTGDAGNPSGSSRPNVLGGYDYHGGGRAAMRSSLEALTQPKGKPATANRQPGRTGKASGKP